MGGVTPTAKTNEPPSYFNNPRKRLGSDNLRSATPQNNTIVT